MITATLHGLIWLVAVGLAMGEKALSQPRAGQQEKAASGNPKPLSENKNAFARYHFDVWTTDNGLPQNSVSSILQTRDGFLWFTTSDGLVRYDGVHFTIFNAGNTKGLKTSRISWLFEDREGLLWIIAEDNSLILYNEGRFTTLTTDDGLPKNQVLQMNCDSDGGFIVRTTSGFARWQQGRFVPYVPGFSGLPFPLQSGVVWYLEDFRLHRVENNRVTAVVDVSGLTDYIIRNLYEDREGSLWIGTSKGVVIRFRDGKFTIYSKKEGLPGNRINIIREDRHGNIWIGLSGGGLFRFKDEIITSYTVADGLADNNIAAIYEDREGILWIGTIGGLSRLRDDIITSYSTADGLAANNTYSICQDRDQTIWIGSWPGLTRYKDGRFTSCSEQYGVTSALVTALMIDREGGLWIGIWGEGVRRWKDGNIISYRDKDKLPSTIVRTILQDRSGAIWFGCSEGLASYKDGAFTSYTTKEGLPANVVNVIFEDSRGNLWIGTQKGLYSYRDGQFSSYLQEKNLSDQIVRAIYEDSEGAIWIGTYNNGLMRIKDGRMIGITQKEGLFNNGVFQILEDATENFWISCNLGIYRVSKKELNDFAEGRSRSITSIPYGKRDGMLNSECNGGVQPAGIKARDGRLWFPTQGGVAIVDPLTVPVSAQPPPVVIEAFLLNQEPVSFHEAVRVEPGTENFEIHYTALSFIMSERINFKYKLEGLDRDWIDAGTRRVAYYSHVPPGNYNFRVIAANRDGVWNLEGASIEVRIIPPFWRTWWFFSLALVTLAGVALFSYKLRIAQLEKAARAQEAFSEQLISTQEAERQRIAAELHDSLGQHLLIIKNSALIGLNSENGKEQLGDISETASQAIDEVREISYNLRPYQLDDLGLTRAIESILKKIEDAAEVRFLSVIDSIDGIFSSEAEIHLYRIVQESLNNIVKHAQASSAHIRIERNGRRVEITIQDDGRGFSPEKTARTERGGFGLKGIAERARMLGAKYVIHSAPGQGTVITLKLEAADGRLAQ
ncbi:MAG: two-component regulator propeller domain-containing protein [Blastocatellia bacterium]